MSTRPGPDDRARDRYVDDDRDRHVDHDRDRPVDDDRGRERYVADDRSRDRYVAHGVRDDLHAREAEEYGGIKWGSAFFGWLTAMGMAVLLTAIASAAGAAVGLSASEAETVTDEEMQTIGIVGAVILLVILFLAYFSGGYVAGRMARFDGAKQGLAVWLWAIIIAALIAVAGWLLGEEFNIYADLNAFPRIPVNEGDLTTWGIIAVVAVALVSLIAAMLGGKAGMRFHRRVDTGDLV